MRNILTVLVLFNGLLIWGCTSNQVSEENSVTDESSVYSTNINEIISEDISEAEIEGLQFMREEEKLARDVYTLLHAKWGKRVFNNIAQSEQRHTNAIKTLINKYELKDLAKTDTPGTFEDKDLQNLYNTLIVKGDSSLVDALLVGALIEEVDINDIQKEIDEYVDNQDIVFVYDNFVNGSYNHLRAFNRNLARQGIVYEPQILSKEQFNSIINQWFINILNDKFC